MTCYNLCNKELNVDLFSQMSFDDIIELYKQGYKLNENITKLNQLSSNSSICPLTMKVGIQKTFSGYVDSGMPPYTYQWSIEKPNGTIETRGTKDISYTFDQVDKYNIRFQVTDSCSAGSLSSNIKLCDVNVEEDISKDCVNMPIFGCVKKIMY